MIRPESVNYELADKQQAIAAGGIGMLLELSKRLGLREEINQAIPRFKLHLPYDEADHVLNIALNLLAGGNCVGHIEADATQVETSAEKKQGNGINYKGQWGHHPLVVTFANTREPLLIVNRSGNRPSHEHSAFYFDLAVKRCRDAGFRKVVLRGETDFALTENFDRWTDDGIEFGFGIDAMHNLVEIA